MYDQKGLSHSLDNPFHCAPSGAFFDGLGNNEGPLSHVIEFADLFRPKSGIAAINELLTSEIT